MAFSDNEVKRAKLDAFEGSTLAKFSSATTLGLASNDVDMATEAKKEVKLDILSRSDRHYHDETYDSRTKLLDDMDDQDDDDLIETLMALKFLEMFFGDQHIGDTDGGQKAQFYEAKYNQALPTTVTYLLSRLDTPKQQNVPRWSR